MEKLSNIATNYLKVIEAYKKRADVQSGEALAYRRNQSLDGPYELINKPHSFGEGTTNTGWCVSVSQNFLNDKIFGLLLVERQAIAKLISIDIKEQHYGVIYNHGNQNKWHTAILVKDNGINFVIDLTCAQFGNAYVNKNIWDFGTWEKTFRSPACKNQICDFDNNLLSFMPITSDVINYSDKKVDLTNLFFDISTITENERKLLSDFFLTKITTLNKKLLIGNIIDEDFKYMNNINKLLDNFKFKKCEYDQYYVMPFDTKESAKKWVKRFLSTESDGGYLLPQYVITSNTIKENCDYFGLNFDKINVDTTTPISYVVFKISNCSGIDISMIKYTSICLPFGIKVSLDIEKDVYNAGQDLSSDLSGNKKTTNTIMINCQIN